MSELSMIKPINFILKTLLRVRERPCKGHSVSCKGRNREEESCFNRSCDDIIDNSESNSKVNSPIQYVPYDMTDSCWVFKKSYYIFLDELVDNPSLLIAEVEDLKRELLALGRELENLQLNNDRLQIKLELEGKSKELENCTNFQELSDGLNNLLQQRIKKTNIRPSNRKSFEKILLLVRFEPSISKSKFQNRIKF